MTKSNNNYAKNIIWVTILISAIYVITRYHIFGGVPWKDFPFFILNKIIAFSGIIFLLINFSLKPLSNLGVRVSDHWLNSRKSLGNYGFIFIMIHAFMSSLQLSSSTYSKLFAEDEKLTLTAGISIFSAIIALTLLILYYAKFFTHLKNDKLYIEKATSKRNLLLAISLVASHLLFLSYNGWINTSAWHAGIIPVSLTAFILIITTFTIIILGKNSY